MLISDNVHCIEQYSAQTDIAASHTLTRYCFLDLAKEENNKSGDDIIFVYVAPALGGQLSYQTHGDHLFRIFEDVAVRAINMRKGFRKTS